MTAEPDLLPLPEGERASDMGWDAQVYGRDEMHAYARACVEANLAPLQAENERLRAEVEDRRRRHAETERDACQLASRLDASEKRAESALAEAFEWRDKFTAERDRAERLAEALRGVMHWDNGKSEWVEARDALAQEDRNG